MIPHHEPRWPAGLALLCCTALYVVLPDRLVVGPRWLLPVLIILPLLPLSARKHHHPDESPWVRRTVIVMLAIITFANVVSVGLLVDRLLTTNVSGGRSLIYSAVAIWLTNVIVYGIWFWEIDGGGPHMRAGGTELVDIQFPQLENPSLAPENWHPRFYDYLYTAFANGTSFAPADAMPLTLRVKVLFATESMVSLIAITVVAARAVNILR